VLRADGCLVTPGLVNTHHHLYQNLTRSFRPVVNGTLFEWLTGLYPRWARLDEEAAYLSAWVGLAELALGGCTTTTDHLYVHPAAPATSSPPRSRPRSSSGCASTRPAAR
jgi:cytosine/adenosine deaminase-related metal-dependent hydrolase